MSTKRRKLDGGGKAKSGVTKKRLNEKEYRETVRKLFENLTSLLWPDSEEDDDGSSSRSHKDVLEKALDHVRTVTKEKEQLEEKLDKLSAVVSGLKDQLEKLSRVLRSAQEKERAVFDGLLGRDLKLDDLLRAPEKSSQGTQTDVWSPKDDGIRQVSSPSTDLTQFSSSESSTLTVKASISDGRPCLVIVPDDKKTKSKKKQKENALKAVTPMSTSALAALGPTLIPKRADGAIPIPRLVPQQTLLPMPQYASFVLPQVFSFIPAPMAGTLSLATSTAVSRVPSVAPISNAASEKPAEKGEVQSITAEEILNQPDEVIETSKEPVDAEKRPTTSENKPNEESSVKKTSEVEKLPENGSNQQEKEPESSSSVSKPTLSHSTESIIAPSKPPSPPVPQKEIPVPSEPKTAAVECGKDVSGSKIVPCQAVSTANDQMALKPTVSYTAVVVSEPSKLKVVEKVPEKITLHPQNPPSSVANSTTSSSTPSSVPPGNAGTEQPQIAKQTEKPVEKTTIPQSTTPLFDFLRPSPEKPYKRKMETDHSIPSKIQPPVPITTTSTGLLSPWDTSSYQRSDSLSSFLSSEPVQPTVTTTTASGTTSSSSWLHNLSWITPTISPSGEPLPELSWNLGLKDPVPSRTTSEVKVPKEVSKQPPVTKSPAVLPSKAEVKGNQAFLSVSQLVDKTPSTAPSMNNPAVSVPYTQQQPCVQQQQKQHRHQRSAYSTEALLRNQPSYCRQVNYDRQQVRENFKHQEPQQQQRVVQQPSFQKQKTNFPNYPQQHFSSQPVQSNTYQNTSTSNQHWAPWQSPSSSLPTSSCSSSTTSGYCSSVPMASTASVTGTVATSSSSAVPFSSFSESWNCPPFVGSGHQGSSAYSASLPTSVSGNSAVASDPFAIGHSWSSGGAPRCSGLEQPSVSLTYQPETPFTPAYASTVPQYSTHPSFSHHASSSYALEPTKRPSQDDPSSSTAGNSNSTKNSSSKSSKRSSSTNKSNYLALPSLFDPTPPPQFNLPPFDGTNSFPSSDKNKPVYAQLTPVASRSNSLFYQQQHQQSARQQPLQQQNQQQASSRTTPKSTTTQQPTQQSNSSLNFSLNALFPEINDASNKNSDPQKNTLGSSNASFVDPPTSTTASAPFFDYHRGPHLSSFGHNAVAPSGSGATTGGPVHHHHHPSFGAAHQPHGAQQIHVPFSPLITPNPATDQVPFNPLGFPSTAGLGQIINF